MPASKLHSCQLQALCFLISLVAVPLAFVLSGFGEGGGLFMIGFVFGAMTAPLLILGIIRAADALFGRSAAGTSKVALIVSFAALLLVAVLAVCSLDSPFGT